MPVDHSDMVVLADLAEDEKYLLAILQDQSGVDQAEFCWTDETSPDFIFRCYDYQYPWYRNEDKYQIDQCVAAGQLVCTEHGWVPIERVGVGTLVLTHKGRWRPVTAKFDQGLRPVVKTSAWGHPGLVSTDDHQIYTRSSRPEGARTPVWATAATLSEASQWGLAAAVAPVRAEVVEQRQLQDAVDHLPVWALGVPERLRRVFLREQFEDCDGEPGTRTTTDRRLALTLLVLAHGLGQPATLSHSKGKSNDFFTVKLMPDATQVGFDGTHAWTSVRKLEPAGRAHVWDLSVEEDESFVVEGVVVHNCSRAVGKSLGIQMRSFSFPFCNAGEEMLLTAPEMIHLEPVTKYVEDRLSSVRLSREFLDDRGNSRGFTHRPFEARFRNGSKIIGRIPQKDGRGVKGQHPLKLEMDEAQDYPEQGWVELGETLKFANPNATWRAHGVSRGVRDRYYKQTQDGSGWTVHRITGMHRPDWTSAEREAKAELYGSRDHPDYRRNVLGLHGDASSVLFVLSRLMQCVDQDKGSFYNREEYTHIRIGDELLKDMGGDITTLLQFPALHQAYDRTWIGMDIGITNHPSEILVFGEYTPESARIGADGGHIKLRLLSRIHLERISTPDQRLAMEAIWDFYRPQAFAFDRTGIGLPIWSEIMNDKNSPNLGFQRAVKPYVFNEKITVAYDEVDDLDFDPAEPLGKPVTANVLEYASDTLRTLVDTQRLILPWDVDLLREFQGSTYQVMKSTTNPYGRKEFQKGKDHALDAARMAVLGHQQQYIDQLTEVTRFEPIMDGFLT